MWVKWRLNSTIIKLISILDETNRKRAVHQRQAASDPHRPFQRLQGVTVSSKRGFKRFCTVAASVKNHYENKHLHPSALTTDVIQENTTVTWVNEPFVVLLDICISVTRSKNLYTCPQTHRVITHTEFLHISQNIVMLFLRCFRLF